MKQTNKRLLPEVCLWAVNTCWWLLEEPNDNHEELLRNPRLLQPFNPLNARNPKWRSPPEIRKSFRVPVIPESLWLAQPAQKLLSLTHFTCPLVLGGMWGPQMPSMCAPQYSWASRSHSFDTLMSVILNRGRPTLRHPHAAGQ